jgi:beta-lactam-binding protein with PASTA domain
MVTVPKLTRLPQAEAERRVRALGLHVVLSYAPETGAIRRGLVNSQWPLAGDQVEAGGEVQLQITVNP